MDIPTDASVHPMPTSPSTCTGSVVHRYRVNRCCASGGTEMEWYLWKYEGGVVGAAVVYYWYYMM